MQGSLCRRLIYFSNTTARHYKTVKSTHGMSQLRDLHKREREIHLNKRKKEKETLDRAKKEALAAIPPLVLFKLSCPGCGAKYQHKLSEKPGYIEYEKMMTWKPSIFLPCERCEKLAGSDHHQMYSISEDRFKKLLLEMAEKRALGLVVCDIVGFPASLPPDIDKMFPPNAPLILIVNKCDVLTDSTAQMEIVEEYYRLLISKWAHHKALKFNDVLFVSAKTGLGIPELAMFIQNQMYGNQMKTDYDFCYLLGVTNVGKSSLFNKLAPLLNNKVKSIGNVTESSVPGTTVSNIISPILPIKSFKNTQDFTTDNLNRKANKLEKLMTQPEESTSNWFKSQIDLQLQNMSGIKLMVDTPGVLAKDALPESTYSSQHKIYRQDVLLEPGQCLSFGWYKMYYVRGNVCLKLGVNTPPQSNMEVIKDVEDATLQHTETGMKLCNKLYLIQSINLPQKKSRNSPVADICMGSFGWISVRLPHEDDVTVVVFGPRLEDIFIRRPGLSLHLPKSDNALLTSEEHFSRKSDTEHVFYGDYETFNNDDI